MNKLLLIVLGFSLVASDILAKERLLPAKFENNQIYLLPTLLDNKQVKFFTDTGGGWNVITKELQQTYKLKTITKKSDNGNVLLCEMPHFVQGKSIPIGGLNNFMEGYLFIRDKEKISPFSNIDGALGGRWHAEKIISFDYINKKMSILESISELNIKKYDEIKLGFQKHNGVYTSAFPRIEIKVLGKALPMLFDTGATARLSVKAKQVLKNKSDAVGTSYIVSSLFDKWQRENPSWLVIKKADKLLNESMIQVPEVQIGDQTIGPVWFTRRQDNNFHEYMSSYMDKKIEGAIGGSLLKYLRIIIDYPNEKAYIFNDNT
jgi:hypothetical protein